MFRLASNTRVFVSPAPCDMRKSFDGLYALTKTVLEQDPLSGHLFVFVNRKRDYAKILYFERGGLCLWAKRLEQGQFAKLTGEQGVASLSDTQLMMWLDGIGLEQRKKLKRFAA
ncbi:MAG: IS66 family insertion sequence element accessory protein TnpB [Gammaproteobacteria bacterium]|nr:IS66 family insertion sequence element accessory protein TnpB [Gammaproteobacteria bacterium]